MNYRYPLMAACVSTLLVIQSCTPDYFDLERAKPINYKPAIALPLVNAKMTVYDILGAIDSGEVLLVDPNDGFVGLVYDQFTESVTVGEFVDIPDESIVETVTLSAAEIAAFQAAGEVEIPVSRTLNMDPGNGIELNEATLKEGSFNFSYNGTLQHSGELQVEFPSITQGGVPFTTTIPFTYSGTTPVVVNETFDLSGYTVDFTNGGTGTNEIQVDLVVKVVDEGNPIQPGDGFEYAISLEQFAFSAIDGDFGTIELEVPKDSIFIRVFSNALAGSFALTNPTINFKLRNSYGIPFEVEFNELASYNTVNQELLPLGGPGLDELERIDRAATPGDVASTSLFLNKDNTTNIQGLISPTPKYLTYDLSVRANPDGAPSPLNFVLDTSSLELEGELILPLEGYASGFLMQDTVDFNFGDDDAIDEIESLNLRIIATNGFPVTANIQIFFFDEQSGQIIDSLFVNDETILESAVVPAGQVRVSSPTEKVTDVFVERDKIPTVVNAEKIIVRVRAETPGSEQEKIVRIFADYEFEIKMGVLIQTDFTVDPNSSDD